MAKKRIMNLAVEGSRADLVSGNFVVLDGPGGTKKIPAYFVRGDLWVFNCPYSQQQGDYTWPDWDAVQDALSNGFNVALRLYTQGSFSFYVCTGRSFEENDQEQTLSVYEFMEISSGMAYVIKYNNDTDTWGTPTAKVYSPSVLWNMPQTLTDPQKAQGRNNIGAAALASLAPAFSTSTAYNEGAVVTYNGALYIFDSAHSAGVWTGADAHEVNVETLIAGVKTGLVFAGNLTDGANVTIPKNNSLSALTTSRASITLEITITPDDPLPNFAVQINNSAALTLIVKVNADAGGGAPIVVSYAAYSSDAGQELEACAAGEINQVTCVGGCWTWAKFLDGSPSP